MSRTPQTALPPALKRLATASAFLIIATVAFAVVVGLVKIARAYLENG